MEIKRERYKELLIAEVKLCLLEASGVDDWEWYSESLDGIEKAIETSLLELGD